MAEPKIYPYRRISSKKQLKGSGMQIQQEDSVTKELSEKFSLPIYDKPLDDIGKSAFKGEHTEHGSLGWFLSGVKSGVIAAGSILVVYSLDRFSRQDIDIALSNLADITKAKVMVYSILEDLLIGDPQDTSEAKSMKFMQANMVFTRGHNESKTKQQRVLAASRRQLAEYKEGRKDKITHNAVYPFWIKSDNTLHPEHSKAVKAAVAEFLKGNGIRKVQAYLNENFTPPHGRKDKKNPDKWDHYTISNLRRNESLIGTRVITVDGDKQTLKGYYPAVISEEDFLRLKTQLPTDFKRKDSKVLPLLSGMKGLIRCGDCGFPMTVKASKHTKWKIKYVCTGAMKNASDCIKQDFDGDLVERSVLLLGHDLIQDTPDQPPIDILKLEQELLEEQKQLETLTNEWKKTRSPTLLSLIPDSENRISELEEKIRESRQEPVNTVSLAEEMFKLYEKDGIFDVFNQPVRSEAKELIRRAVQSVTLQRFTLTADELKQMQKKSDDLCKEKSYSKEISSNYYISPKGNPLHINMISVEFRDGTYRNIIAKPLEVHHNHYVADLGITNKNGKDINLTTANTIRRKLEEADALKYFYPNRGRYGKPFVRNRFVAEQRDKGDLSPLTNMEKLVTQIEDFTKNLNGSN